MSAAPEFATVADVSPAAPHPCCPIPYPGLRSFEEADGPIFFGRGKQVAALLHKLGSNRFVAVVGSSGSGKSSLVKAGLFPAIRSQLSSGSEPWMIVESRPGASPYRSLVAALQRVRRPDGAPLLPGDALKDFMQTLRRTDSGLLRALRPLNLAPQSRLLVVLDQFEEIFAFRRGNAILDSFAPRREAAAFASMLLASCRDTDSQVWVLITMRSDFIGDCEAFLGLPEMVSHSQFLVPRLDFAQMQDAILRPSRLASEGYQPFSVPEELVSLIIGEAGDRPDQLPLMQHALMRTWKSGVARARQAGGPVQLAITDYVWAGRIEFALSQHAEEAWLRLEKTPPLAELCRKLFLLLCDVSGEGQIVRRRPRVGDVLKVTGAEIEEIQNVVRAFQEDDRNFLVAPQDRPLQRDDVLDVSHEALLRQWKRYAEEWQPQERANAAELGRLAGLAALWKQQPQDRFLSDQYVSRIAPWWDSVSQEWGARYLMPDQWKDVQAFLKAEKDAANKSARETEAKEAQLWLAETQRKYEAGRVEEEKKKRMWLWCAGVILALALVVSVAATLAAIHSRNQAGEAAMQAKHERDVAKVATDKALAAADNVRVASAAVQAALQSVEKEEAKAVAARAEAEKARIAADGLIQYMQSNLAAKLAPVGNLELLGDISRHILDYRKTYPSLVADAEEEKSAALALSQYGAVLVAQGKTAQGLDLLQQSAGRFSNIYKADPSLANALNSAKCLSRIGSLQLQQDDRSAAKASFTQAYQLLIAAGIDAQMPGAEQEVLAGIETQLGDVAYAYWVLDEAYDSYTKALKIRKSIITDEESCQRNYAQSLSRIGSVETSRNHWPAAHASLDEAVQILRRLNTNDPTNTQTRFELSQALGNAAELAMQEYWADSDSGTKLRAAQKLLDECLQVRLQLARQDLTNVQWQRDLWKIQIYRGEVYQVLGGAAGSKRDGLDIALESYQDSLEVAQRLGKAYPESKEFKGLVAASFTGIGDVQKYSGNIQEALASYEQARMLREELLAAARDDSDRLFDKAMIYASMADAVVRGHGDLERARQLVKMAVDIAHGFAGTDPIRKERNVQLKWIDDIAAEAQRGTVNPSAPRHRGTK